MAKDNNFSDTGKKRGEIETVSSNSELRYRKLLDPLEQSDEDASQERWGSTSKQKGETYQPFSRGLHTFIDDTVRGQGYIKAGVDGSLAVQWNAIGHGVDVPKTQLDGGINAIQTTITVDSTEKFKTTDVDGMVNYQRLIINSEIIYYSGKTATTFTGCLRGAEQTTPQSHANNDEVRLAPGVFQLGTVIFPFDPIGPAMQPAPGLEGLVNLGASRNPFNIVYADASNIFYYALVSSANDPTTSDIPSGYWTAWKNTTTGLIRFWLNDAGTMKAIPSGSTIYSGRVNTDGTADTPFPSGWTVENTGVGDYTVTHNLDTTAYNVLLTSDVSDHIVSLGARGTDTFTVVVSDDAGVADDAGFFFMVNVP